MSIYRPLKTSIQEKRVRSLKPNHQEAIWMKSNQSSEKSPEIYYRAGINETRIQLASATDGLILKNI